MIFFLQLLEVIYYIIHHLLVMVLQFFLPIDFCSLKPRPVPLKRTVSIDPWVQKLPFQLQSPLPR